MNYYIAPSPCGSVRMRSKWLTDNTDATDLFFTDFVFMWIDMRLYGALIYTDFSCWSLSAPYRRKYYPNTIQDQVTTQD